MKTSKTDDAVLKFLFENQGGSCKIPDIVAGTKLPESEVRASMCSLRKKEMIGGPPMLIERVTEALEGNIEPTARGYAEHLILLASALGGKADEDFLAKELSFDKEFVSLVGSRLRSSGIWVGDSISSERPELWAKDSVAFFMDGAVATGDLKIVGGPPENRKYQMTETGKTAAANLIKRMTK